MVHATYSPSVKRGWAGGQSQADLCQSSSPCSRKLTSHTVATGFNSSLVCIEQLPLAVKHEGMHWGAVVHGCGPHPLCILHCLNDVQLSNLDFVGRTLVSQDLQQHVCVCEKGWCASGQMLRVAPASKLYKSHKPLFEIAFANLHDVDSFRDLKEDLPVMLLQHSIMLHNPYLVTVDRAKSVYTGQCMYTTDLWLPSWTSDMVQARHVALDENIMLLLCHDLVSIMLDTHLTCGWSQCSSLAAT